MNTTPPPVKRILIALDSSASTPNSLTVAAELASRLRAELRGLFVEDNDLLKLAALPFTTQINLTTGTRQPLETSELESQMASLAAAAQRRLAAVAERDRLIWSFRTVRGQIAREIANAAEDADLVIVEGGQHGGPAHARIGLPASATVKQVNRSVLILRAGRHFEGPIFVTFDGTAQSGKALRMAAALARNGNLLTVSIPEGADHEGLETEARTLLGSHAETARFETYSAKTLPELCAHVGGRNAGLVVMSTDDPLLSSGDVMELLDSVTCTILLVR